MDFNYFLPRASMIEKITSFEYHILFPDTMQCKKRDFWIKKCLHFEICPYAGLGMCHNNVHVP